MKLLYLLLFLAIASAAFADDVDQRMSDLAYRQSEARAQQMMDEDQMESDERRMQQMQEKEHFDTYQSQMMNGERDY